MESDEWKNEYVLNDSGCVYWSGLRPKPWFFGQVFRLNFGKGSYRKTIISYPLINTCAYAYLAVRSVNFLENLAHILNQ